VSARVSYLVDRRAGVGVLGEGALSSNPFVVRIHWGADSVREYTVGGTTYDLQMVGPALRSLCFAAGWPGEGAHATWLYSGGTTGQFPDLNMRYNFYDHSAGEWSWIYPDFMQSGVNIFAQGTLGGSHDADPETGVAVVSGLTGFPSGVEDRPENPRPTSRPAGIVRGVLSLPASLITHSSSLITSDGRKVMELVPGENDVRHLASGVYLVITPHPNPLPQREREKNPSPATGRERMVVRKVVLQK